MPNANFNYEHLRTVLTMNLCQVLKTDLLNEVLKQIDITLNDFDVTPKNKAIIVSEGVPDIVKVYIASKVIANVSKGTLKQYSYKLFHFFNTVKKSYVDITSNDIRMYLYTFKEDRKVSDHYIDNIRLVLNGFFQWLVDNQYISVSPCANVERVKFEEKEREPLTSYELELFRWNTKGIREKALVDFLFATGCRVSECANVKLSDIDWEKRSVVIRHGKGNKQRKVYFNAESELSLQKYLESRKGDSDALFTSIKAPYNPLQVGAIQSIFKKISARAGIHVFPHKMRHTFATFGIRGGMSLERLQALLGHAKPQTTLIYAKLDQLDLQREHQRVYA